MTKYRVTTRNGDTLFYGVKSTLKSQFAFWNHIEFQGSQAQHTELGEHLSRHNSQWSWHLRANDIGVYHLPPYFKLEEVSDNEREDDAAVHNWVNPAVVTPSFPAPNVADPYTSIIDVNYAFAGERFRTEEVRGGRKFIRYGTFHMDGNAISKDYGWHTFEEEGDERTYNAKVKAYGPGSGKQYINVRYDDQPEGYYEQKTGERAFRTNEGLDPDKPGLKIYGLPEVAARKGKRAADARQARLLREAQERVQRAEDELRYAKSQLQRVENSGKVGS